jgi:hypothetical protein
MKHYRVDFRLSTTGALVPYSADKVELGMALGLAEHLKRNHTGGRVVEVPSGKVIEDWS